MKQNQTNFRYFRRSILTDQDFFWSERKRLRIQELNHEEFYEEMHWVICPVSASQQKTFVSVSKIIWHITFPFN